MKPLQEDSQCARILGYLAHGNQVTAIDALEKFRCFRLAARIKDLRRRGHSIGREMIELDSGKRVASYSLSPASQR